MTNKTVRWVAVAALTGVALAGCASEPEVVTETITETVTETIEVEAVPQVCLDAFDQADELITISAEYNEWLRESGGSSTGSIDFDPDRGIEGLNEDLQGQTVWLEDLTERLESNEYSELRDECRGAA